MSRKWSPAEWNAFVKGPLANAITEQANREALEAGLIEMDNGQKMRIVSKDIIDTGDTLSSVGHRIIRVSADGGEGESGPGTHYAIYHEFGTYKMTARPYMRPTVDEDKDRIVRAASTAFENAIERLF